MPHTIDERPGLIAALEGLIQELAASEWWQSRARRDLDRRRWSEYFVNSLKESIGQGYLSVGFVHEQIKLLRTPELAWEEVVIGQSVGFKKPGPGQIRWVDVRGVADPSEASQMVRNSSLGRKLLGEGYLEYGISAMKARVKKEPATGAVPAAGLGL